MRSFSLRNLCKSWYSYKAQLIDTFSEVCGDQVPEIEENLINIGQEIEAGKIQEKEVREVDVNGVVTQAENTPHMEYSTKSEFPEETDSTHDTNSSLEVIKIHEKESIEVRDEQFLEDKSILPIQVSNFQLEPSLSLIREEWIAGSNDVLMSVTGSDALMKKEVFGTKKEMVHHMFDEFPLRTKHFSHRKTSLFPKSWKFKFKKQNQWNQWGMKCKLVLLCSIGWDSILELKSLIAPELFCVTKKSLIPSNWRYSLNNMELQEGKQHRIQHDGKTGEPLFQMESGVVGDNDSVPLTWVQWKIMQCKKKILRLFVKDWKFKFKRRTATNLKGLRIEEKEMEFTVLCSESAGENMQKELKDFWEDIHYRNNGVSDFRCEDEAEHVSVHKKKSVAYKVLDAAIMEYIEDCSHRLKTLYSYGSLPRPPELNHAFRNLEGKVLLRGEICCRIYEVWGSLYLFPKV